MIYNRQGGIMDDRALGRFDYQRAIERHEARMRARHELERAILAAAQAMADEPSSGNLEQLKAAVGVLRAFDSPKQ